MIHFTHFQTFLKIPEKVRSPNLGQWRSQNEAEEAMVPPETKCLDFYWCFV